jgi:RHS repeat-associated protein
VIANVGGTEQFTWDVSGSVPQLLACRSTYFLYGPNVGSAPIEQIAASGGSKNYLVSDPTGVREAISSSGAVTGTINYDSYGSPCSGCSIGTPFGFEGGYTDGTGLIYVDHRYYDPSTEQFMSVDREVADTDQPYVFVQGDPVNESDPSGDLFCQPGGTCGSQQYFAAQRPSVASPPGVSLNIPTPEVIVNSVGYLQTVVSGEVTYANSKTKPVVGITPSGAIETQVGSIEMTFNPSEELELRQGIGACSVPLTGSVLDLSLSCTKDYTNEDGPLTIKASITVSFQVNQAGKDEAEREQEYKLYPEFAVAGTAVIATGARALVACIEGAVCYVPGLAGNP